MTIKGRLARSNLVMLLIPILVAAVLLLAGGAVAMVLLDQVYLPRLGLTAQALHQTGEQVEDLLYGLKTFACIYGGAVILATLVSVVLTDLYLTRGLLRHIAEPLEALVAGVGRIRDGDLDAPIAYRGKDEFKEACDAIDRMAARLKTSLEQEQRQQQKKQELIAGMSHDLKSPLTSIRAYTEALLEGVAQDDAARERYLRTILAREGDIETMVARLSQLARLDMDDFPVQLVSLSVREELESLCDGWSATGVEVVLDGLPDAQILADRELLERIVSDLLDNSRKYGGRDPVHVTVTAQEDGDLLAIAFADDGPGVPEEQLPKLFDMFYRGDAARSAPGKGSGIGLAVVKKAVEQMHGRVTAQNGPAGGLCITVSLPLAGKEEDHG